MIHVKKLNPKEDVVFQRISPSTGEYQVIAITRLIRFCHQCRMKTTTFGIETHKAREIVAMGRINKLNLVRIPADAMKIPLLFIDDTTGPDLIDGNHRYVRAAIMGMPYLEGFLADRTVWMQYLVKGLPKLTEEELRRAR